MKKGIGIVIFIVIVIISLGLSIYLPNKDKINDEAEDKSVIYSVIEENGKYGVKNQDEKVIVKPQYEQVVIPNEHRGIFICDNDGEKTVVYNEKGSEILKDYDAVEPIKLSNLLEEKYEKNAIIYQKNGKYGLLSITGKVILDARYEQIYSLGYKENEVIVKDNNKYKIYDVKGKQLIKDEFDSIQSDEYYNEQDEYKKSGYIVCKTTSDGYRYGYYDYDYDQVLTTDYNQILRIVNVIDKNNVYLIASKNGQYGVFINNVKIINNYFFHQIKIQSALSFSLYNFPVSESFLRISLMYFLNCAFSSSLSKSSLNLPLSIASSMLLYSLYALMSRRSILA